MQELIIPIVFVFLTVLLTWFLLDGRGWWPLKLGLLACSVWISLQIWQAENSYKGLPSPMALEQVAGKHAWLFWAYAEGVGTPDAKICMLMRLEEEIPQGALAYQGFGPKLYVFPYSTFLHLNVEVFRDAILTQGGQPLRIAFTGEPDGNNPDGSKRGDMAGSRGAKLDGDGTRSGHRVEEYIEPPAAQPSNKS